MSYQTDDQILKDVDEFYFGGYIPWLHSITREDDALIISMDNPSTDEATEYRVTAPMLRAATDNAYDVAYMCCKSDIRDDGLGYGCAQDLDAIIQIACFGELVYG